MIPSSRLMVPVGRSRGLRELAAVGMEHLLDIVPVLRSRVITRNILMLNNF